MGGEIGIMCMALHCHNDHNNSAMTTLWDALLYGNCFPSELKRVVPHSHPECYHPRRCNCINILVLLQVNGQSDMTDQSGFDILWI